MSEQDPIKLLEKQNQLVVEQREMLEKKYDALSVEHKESEVKFDTAISELTDAMNDIKKKAKNSAILSEMSNDEQKRKEMSEFMTQLKDLGGKSSTIKEIDTLKFKSFIERKDYNSEQDPVGGVAVIPFVDTMIRNLVRELTDVDALVGAATISTDKWIGTLQNQTNGAKWRHEMGGDFASQTKNNTFNELSITVEDLFGIAKFSDNLIEDQAFDIVGAVLSSLSRDYALKIAAGLWTGSGVGEMKGILTADDASDSFDKVERFETAGSGAITMDDMIDFIGQLKKPYRQNRQMRGHRNILTYLRKLKSPDEVYLWEQSSQLDIPSRILGVPIEESDELASSVVANAEPLVYGDFKQGYLKVNNNGTRIFRDETTDWPNVGYRSKMRVGGGVVLGEALKILKVKA